MFTIIYSSIFLIYYYYRFFSLRNLSTKLAPTTSQYAAIEAMTNGEEDVQIMRNAYNQRRRFVLELFSEMGLKCFEPEGAFYIFPCIKEFGMTSDEFANPILHPVMAKDLLNPLMIIVLSLIPGREAIEQ